jgi:bifunctional ADP-heptose synthase (sugar kinase/adenylyltransferase)
VKGGDWKIENIVGADFVMSYGGKVYTIDFVYNTSTTKIIEKVKNESA